jgi:hypothetical protein
MNYRVLAGLAAAAALSASLAHAEPIHVEAVMSPKQSMRLDFADGSKHFVLMVQREGQSKGSGPLAGAKVTEFGMHDITPGVGGDPRGYLVFTATNGDTAYIKWQVRAVFVRGADGKPVLLDNGFWEVAGATGELAGLTGAGTLHIKPASETDRRFELTGEIVRK